MMTNERSLRMIVSGPALDGGHTATTHHELTDNPMGGLVTIHRADMDEHGRVTRAVWAVRWVDGDPTFERTR